MCIRDSSNTAAHTFVSATAGAVIAGGNYTHSFVSAVSNCVTAPGDCANVQNAIDNLVTIANDIIAPTSETYAIAADRLYFNRQAIAREITQLTTQEFTYDLGGSQYSAFSYPEPGGEVTCQRDVKLIITSMISDLQTGGTNSTLAAMELYLSANTTIINVEEELLATTWALEQLGWLGEHAIQNRLYDLNSGQPAPAYNFIFTTDTAYRDTLTPNAADVAEVVSRWKEILNIALNVLAPGKRAFRGAAKNLIYNRNYYKEEITTLVTQQFGGGSWLYNDWIDEVITNLSHDLITTDESKTTLAYKITIEDVVGNFEMVNRFGVQIVHQELL